MLIELLNKKPDFFVGRWNAFPPANCRAEWETLPDAAHWKNTAKETVHAAQHVPGLPLSLWLEFTENGNRSHYEHAYFLRRRHLCRLVMTECIDYHGELLPLIADYVWAICEESAWQLPAHNSYIRDTPQLPLPDIKRPIVDLFAAETGALISMVYYLLGKELARIAPGLDKRMKHEVERRVLVPWSRRHFWWMGNGSEPMCNWTPWCTQNCLIACALLHGDSQTRIQAAVRQAAYSMDCFLKDYGEDGCCSEGAQYYRHAGLTFFNALEILCALAPGVFDNAWNEPKIRNLAEYIAQMHVAGSYYLNFSDCSPLAGVRGAREYLFGKRVGSLPLMSLAAHDFLRDPDPYHLSPSDDSEGINLFYMVQTAFSRKEISAFAKQHPMVSQKDVWYPSVGLRVCRAGAFTVGIKAGGNDDSHNHNDTGSVTLYKDGQPLLIDIGVETYSKKTFSPNRYEIWTMQSCWHNLPRFYGKDGTAYDQKAGPVYAAKEIKLLPDGLAMDIAPAYGIVPGLGFYRRRVILSPTGLTITDDTDYSGEVCLTLMSCCPVHVEQNMLMFGTLAQAALTGNDVNVTVEPVSVTDPRLRQMWPDTLYRTLIYFDKRLEIIVR